MVVPGEELESAEGMAVTVSVPTKKPEKAKQNPKVKKRKKKEID